MRYVAAYVRYSLYVGLLLGCWVLGVLVLLFLATRPGCQSVRRP